MPKGIPGSGASRRPVVESRPEPQFAAAKLEGLHQRVADLEDEREPEVLEAAPEGGADELQAPHVETAGEDVRPASGDVPADGGDVSDEGGSALRADGLPASVRAPNLPDGFSPMDSVPTGGKPFWAWGIGEGPDGPQEFYKPAYQHRTRVWKGSATRWVETSWIAALNTPGDPLPFEVFGWKRYE